MTDTTGKQQHPDPDSIAGPTTEAPSAPQRLKQKVVSIRTKMTVLTLALIALITAGSSMVVIQNMDQVLDDSLVERGATLALSTATPAGYSILAKDRLALDNLAAKIKTSQEDILYLAIVDIEGNILAHSDLEETGTRFIQAGGQPVARGESFTMHRVARDERATFEFQSPIIFAGNQVGTVVAGIDALSLTNAKNLARSRIMMIALIVMGFGAFGTFLLSRLVTAPIARLSAGVSQITAGNYQVKVETHSADELGELTRSFNKMSQVIMTQKQHLEDYAGDLEDAYISTVRILAAALDARDNYTLGHSARVARLALMIGERIGLTAEELKELEMACFLHDIGKIHVPDLVLNKPIPLDQAEFKIIKKHPSQGAEVLRLAESLHKYIPVVLHHHEWFNGQGYPHGLKEEEIHLFAQIVAIADSYDAMTSSRPYRKGCSRDEATAEILEFSGRQFNPELVEIFIAALSDYEDDEALFKAGGPYATDHYLSGDQSDTDHDPERLQSITPLVGEPKPGTYPHIH